MTPFAVLLSGRGTNMEALARNSLSGNLDGRIVLVASDNLEAEGLAKAAALGFPTKCYPYGKIGRLPFEERVSEDIANSGAEWVVLAGFMRILSPYFVSRFRGKIVNIHPSLLPAFPGTDAIGKAWRYGVRVTGVTVHLVDEQVDHGMILAQEPVRIGTEEPLASLESRIHKVEHELYWRTLQGLFKSEIRTYERRPAP